MTFDFEKYKSADEESRCKEYPQCRVQITWVEGGCEVLWGRVVGRPDLVMIDNDPLDERYRYADVVRVRNNEVIELVQRTFDQRFGFRWVPAADEDADLEIRQDIYERWGRLGSGRVSGSFFSPGIGYLLATNAVSHKEVLQVMTAGDSPIVDMVAMLPDGEHERFYLDPSTKPEE